MTSTNHETGCLIFICTCTKDEPKMTPTKTYTYSFQVDPEVDFHFKEYFKIFEELGYSKAKAEDLITISKLRYKLMVAENALDIYSITNQAFPEFGDVAREALAKIRGNDFIK